MFRRGRRGHVELVAVGWGGLVAGAGMIAASGYESSGRLAIIVPAFLAGGFLAGMRARRLRVIHAALAAVSAYVLHATWILLARGAEVVGAPDAPDLVIGEGRQWLVGAALSLGLALVGGMVASRILRPTIQRLGN